jgi:hypothetical protein
LFTQRTIQTRICEKLPNILRFAYLPRIGDSISVVFGFYIFEEKAGENNACRRFYHYGFRLCRQPSDAEVLAAEIVGEFLEFGSDKASFEYFKARWLSRFPNLGARTRFEIVW